jgi:cytochrome d ubiquinol oxidase subunit I
VFLELSKRWSRGAAILFAVGAVSGTVLAFELGLLWPGFMEKAGAIIGMPFSLEGFAFFAEAIFLGLYLAGWNRAALRSLALRRARRCERGPFRHVRRYRECLDECTRRF